MAVRKRTLLVDKKFVEKLASISEKLPWSIETNFYKVSKPAGNWITQGFIPQKMRPLDHNQLLELVKEIARRQEGDRHTSAKFTLLVESAQV